MRPRPLLSKEARADLEEIRQYTAEQFGDEQARRYLSELRQAFERLASFPRIGQEIAKGTDIRCWIHRGQYRVLYRERGDRLELGRIIHCAREREFQIALDLLLGRP